MPNEKTSKKAKPKLAYQAPKLVALGESDTGFGAACKNGPVASNCSIGSAAGARCREGSRP